MRHHVSQFQVVTTAMQEWISLLGQSKEDWEGFANSRHGKATRVQWLRNGHLVIKAVGGPVFIQKPPDLCRYFIKKQNLVGLRVSMVVPDHEKFDLAFMSQMAVELKETRKITQGDTMYDARRYLGTFQGTELETVVVKCVSAGTPKVQVTLGLPNLS